MEPSNLALFWAGVLACSILFYVILDGFDLGVGMLFGTTRNEAHRVRMMNTIAPFWDGNETWLVVIGAGLFAAFPDVYAIFLGAFYFPVLLLLFGLIFRGIAFEFRFRSVRMRWLWDWGFFLGSTVVAFVQGAAVGAMIRGTPGRGWPVRRRSARVAAPVCDPDRDRARARVRAARGGLACAQERRRVARLGLRPHSDGWPAASSPRCSSHSRSRSTTASLREPICRRDTGASRSP